MINNFAPPIKVPYSISPIVSSYLWPILEIELKYKDYRFPYKLKALVDSGASHSVIRPEIAKILGFDLSKGKRFSGRSVGGSHEHIQLPDFIEVDVLNHNFSFRFLVIETMEWECILGQDTIFEVAELSFQKFNGYFEVNFRQDIN